MTSTTKGFLFSNEIAWLKNHPLAILPVCLVIVVSWGWALGNLSVGGCYYLEGTNDTVYTVLENTGTYYQVQEGKCCVDGTYLKNGDEIQFHHLFGVFVMTKDGNVLIDEDGDRWIKK